MSLQKNADIKHYQILNAYQIKKQTYIIDWNWIYRYKSMAETCVAGGQQSKVLGNREKMGDTSLIQKLVLLIMQQQF